MKRQRNTTQMKEQTRNTEVQINEEEIGKLNAGLEEAQAEIKIAGRNINNLRYADDTTLMQKVKKN